MILKPLLYWRFIGNNFVSPRDKDSGILSHQNRWVCVNFEFLEVFFATFNCKILTIFGRLLYVLFVFIFSQHNTRGISDSNASPHWYASMDGSSSPRALPAFETGADSVAVSSAASNDSQVVTVPAVKNVKWKTLRRGSARLQDIRSLAELSPLESN